MAERWPDWIHDGATAVVFLTRIPVPWSIPGPAGRLQRCTPWFPAVGVLVGLAGAFAWWLGSWTGHSVLAALAAVAATALVTGAFHEDGLADTFDGLGGASDRDSALAIMKDSRLGTFGAVALILVVAARVGALAALATLAPAALVAAHALARFTSLPAIRWLPYARADGGTGKPFAGGVSPAGMGVAGLATLLLTLLLLPDAFGWAWLGAAVGSGVVIGWSRARLGGITGDTLGAGNQLAELGVYLALLVVLA